MRDIHDLAPDEILRVYFSERRRRENPPSLAGLEPDQPRERKPSSGQWESLLGLVRGCNARAIEIMYVASGSWRVMATGWLCPVQGCGQWVDHRHSDVLGTDGQPLMSGGQPITTPVSNSVPATALASQYGLKPEEVKLMVQGVLERVAENLGARRGRERQLDRDNPTVADLKAVARMVWR